MENNFGNVSRCDNNRRVADRWFRDFEERNMTREEQSAFMQRAGLVSDVDEVRQHLNNIGLTALRPYICHFLTGNGSVVCFREGTAWSDVHSLYEFDRRLRFLVFLGIQMFDAAFREQISYLLENRYGPYWHHERHLFKEPRRKRLHDSRIAVIDVHEDIRRIIDRYEARNRRDCTFRSCHRLFYFSHYSRIYSHLREKSDRQRIAWHFHVPPHIFCSWVHTLVKVRNLCAHNEYLWKRIFDVVPDELTFSTKHFWINNSAEVERDRIYYILCILKFLLQTVNPRFGFSGHLFYLTETYKSVISLPEMGFPENWEQEKLWRMTN